MNNFLSRYNRYYFIAFIEGGYILAIELMIAKMIAPIYGASLLIWSSVIGLTLFSTATGYFIGGKLSGKSYSSQLVYFLLMTTGVFIALIPLIIYPLILICDKTGFIPGIFILTFFLLFPSLFSISLLSPLLIQFISSSTNVSGKVAGKIYAFSTIGGIITTFLIGFYIIPQWGITYPILFLGLLIILIGTLLFLEKKNIFLGIIFLILFIFEATVLISKKIISPQQFSLIYYREGILGQINIIESKKYSENEINIRSLSLNGMFQTRIENIYPGNSVFEFTHILAAFSSLKPAGSSALLLGFGGGSVAKELTQLGFSIDAVDLDERLMKISKDYFYFNDSLTNFIVDDARHFIRVSPKKYDVVIIDVTLGEVHPSHVFTLESFEKMKNILNKNAIILINYTSYVNNELGKASRSVFKTLKHSGFHTYAYYKNSDRFTDVIYIASQESINFSFSQTRLNNCCIEKLSESNFLKSPVADIAIEEKNDYVLTDDKPLLDNLNMLSIRHLRERSMEGAKEKIREGVRFFK